MDHAEAKYEQGKEAVLSGKIDHGKRIFDQCLDSISNKHFWIYSHIITKVIKLFFDIDFDIAYKYVIKGYLKTYSFESFSPKYFFKTLASTLQLGIIKEGRVPYRIHYFKRELVRLQQRWDKIELWYQFYIVIANLYKHEGKTKVGLAYIKNLMENHIREGRTKKLDKLCSVFPSFCFRLNQETEGIQYLLNYLYMAKRYQKGKAYASTFDVIKKAIIRILEFGRFKNEATQVNRFGIKQTGPPSHLIPNLIFYCCLRNKIEEKLKTLKPKLKKPVQQENNIKPTKNKYKAIGNDLVCQLNRLSK